MEHTLKLLMLVGPTGRLTVATTGRGYISARLTWMDRHMHRALSYIGNDAQTATARLDEQAAAELNRRASMVSEDA